MASRGAALTAAAARETRDWVERVDGAEALETALVEPTQGGAVGLAAVLDRPAIPAQWTGQAAQRLGLTGEATREQLDQVLDKGEFNGTKLRSDGTGNTAYGLIWNAPKSVSALLAHHDPEVRKAVDEATKAAGEAYIAALEETVRSRTGKRGKNSVAIDGLVSAQYLHHTSSTGDPHAHVHMLMLATAPCTDAKGRTKWRTLDSKTVFSAKRIADAAATRAMRDVLDSRLDLGEGAWRVREVGSVSVPELKATLKQSDALSGAKRHIAEVLTAAAKTLGDLTFREHLTAWRQHRKGKEELAERVEHELDAGLAEGGEKADAIRRMWHDRAEGLGDALATIQPKPKPATPRGQVKDPAKFWRENKDRDDEVGTALQKLDRRILRWIEGLHNWTVADVAARLTTEMGNPAGSLELAGEMVEQWAADGLVHSRPGIAEACRAVAHRETIKTETIHQGVGLHAKCVSDASIKIELALQDDAQKLAAEQRQRLAIDVSGLSDEQAEAATLAAQGRGLAVISGVAGAGKTTMLSRVADGARARGMRVVSVARNAARGVETGEGINADLKCSIAALLKQPIERWGARKPVLLVIDEGGVVDRDDWQKLIELSKSGKVQIVACGDRDQAQPIDRKAGWSVVQAGAADENQHRHLRTSWRCKAWTDEASAIRAGDSDTVLKAAEGRISGVSEDKIADEAAQRVHENGAAVALTVSNAEASDISRRVQKLRGIEPSHPISGDSFAGIGDRVRTRRNDYKLGLLNGDRWTVRDVFPSGAIELESEKGSVTVPSDYARQFVELDYAATVDSAQGITVQKAVCVLREGTGRSYLYSAATRGRQAPEYLIAGQNDQARKALRNIVQTNDTAQTAREIAASIKAEAEPQKPENKPQPKPEDDTSTLFVSKEQLVAAYRQQQRERDEARARRNPNYIDPVPRPRMRPR